MLDYIPQLVRAIARSSGCVVVLIDFRLAPEYKFPTPVNDCYSALSWVATHANRLGIDPRRIAVGGDR